MESIVPYRTQLPTEVTGRIESGDRDVFSIELKARQWYSIEVQYGHEGGVNEEDRWKGIQYAISPFVREMRKSPTWIETGRASDSIGFQAHSSGMHWLELRPGFLGGPTFDYDLRVREVAEPPSSTSLEPVTRVHTLTTDAPLAIEMVAGFSPGQGSPTPTRLVMRVEAGQSVLLSIDAGPDVSRGLPVPQHGDPRAYLDAESEGHWFYPRVRLDQGSTAYVLSSEVGESFTLDVDLSTDWTGRASMPLTFRVDPAPLDDHSNLRSGATPMQIGETVNFRSELPGDIDWFRFDVRAGDLLVALVENPGQEYVWVQSRVSMVDGQNVQVFSAGRQTPYPLRWIAEHDGVAFIGLMANRSGLGSSDWRDLGPLKLTVQRVPGDADLTPGHPPVEDSGALSLTQDRDTPAAPPPTWGSAVPLHGELSAVEPVGRSFVWLDAGQRYLLQVRGELEWWGVLFAGEDASAYRPFGYASAFQLTVEGERASPSGDWIIASPVSGWALLTLEQHAWASFGQRLPYEVSLQPMPDDDHGDTPGRATVLTPGQVASASLAPSDQDVFALDLVAGQRYGVQVKLDRNSRDSWATLVDSNGEYVDTWFPTLHSIAHFIQVEHGGRYFLALEDNGRQATVSYHPVAPDEHGDTRSAATPIRVIELQFEDEIRDIGDLLDPVGVSSLDGFDPLLSGWR